MILLDLDGTDVSDKYDIHFLSRIFNDGTKLIDLQVQPWFPERAKITVFCLSMTYQKYIATDRDSTYIVELFDKKTKEKLPKN